MRITNLNCADDIGASAWLVEVDGCRLLLDAGMHPKHDGNAALPLFAAAAGLELDAIALSHCHHDHVGALPVALRQFPGARVFVPEQSYFLLPRVLHNSVNVMKRQRAEAGIAEYPLFDHSDVDQLMQVVQACRYRQVVEWGVPPRPRAGPMPTLEFFDAGHVLGSAGVLVRGRKDSLFYTGDVCFAPQSLLAGARFEEVRARVLLTESTRGATARPKGFSREAELARLRDTIAGALSRGASVLVPAFALGRTQELLAWLAMQMREGALPRRKVHVGGLGRAFTEIYDQQAHRTERLLPDLALQQALELQVLEEGDAQNMSLKGGKLFVTTAGMMTERTAAHDLAVRLMGEARQCICFVGYADPDSPGGRLKASEAGRTFRFSDLAPQVVRRCELHVFDLSAHAQREELVGFAAGLAPRTVLLGHGDPPARKWLAGQIARRLPSAQVLQPRPGESVAL